MTTQVKKEFSGAGYFAHMAKFSCENCGAHGRLGLLKSVRTTIACPNCGARLRIKDRTTAMLIAFVYILGVNQIVLLQRPDMGIVGEVIFYLLLIFCLLLFARWVEFKVVRDGDRIS